MRVTQRQPSTERAIVRRALMNIVALFPLALFGNFVSYFWQHGDMARAALALLGGLALVAAYLRLLLPGPGRFR